MKKATAIFLGRKPYAAKALQFLIKKNINIKFVSAPPIEKYHPNLKEICKENNIPIMNSDKINQYIKRNPKKVDLVISYLFWKRIHQSLFNMGKKGCVNYHPAILPDYKGLGGYNLAIIHNLKTWGSSVHYVDSEKFDEGPIINVKKFSINPDTETAYSLEKKTQKSMYLQFKKTILKLIKDVYSNTKPNKGGLYFSRNDYNKFKKINLNEPVKLICRKIRAFWFPPYDGAFVEKEGIKFTLVTKEILDTLK